MKCNRILFALILTFAGCRKPKDEALKLWLSEAAEIDIRVNKGMPVMGNGLFDSISYQGTSPKKAAENIITMNESIKRIGAIIKNDTDPCFPSYSFRASKGAIEGVIIMHMAKDKSRDYISWGWRFYDHDFFHRMENNYSLHH